MYQKQQNVHLQKVFQDSLMYSVASFFLLVTFVIPSGENHSKSKVANFSRYIYCSSKYCIAPSTIFELYPVFTVPVAKNDGGAVYEARIEDGKLYYENRA